MAAGGRRFRAGVFLCLTVPRVALVPRLPWAGLGRAVGAPTTQPDGVAAIVLAVDVEGMTVQFEDRADTNYIRFSDRKWMDYISVVE